MQTNRESGERWNNLYKRVVERGVRRFTTAQQLLLADGFPPFHAPLEDQRALYASLNAMRLAGNPGDLNDPYYGNPAAVKTLTALERIFGPATTGAQPFPQPTPGPLFPPQGRTGGGV